MPRVASWAWYAGALVLVVGLPVLAWQASIRSVDFPVYHRIGTEVLAGDFTLYPPEAFDGRLMPAHAYRYLPAVAALFAPLALLPLRWAAFAFFLGKLAAFVYIARTLARALRRRDPTVLGMAAFLVVGGYAIEEALYGNAHLYVVALMVLAYDRSERGEVIVPASALGLAVAVKLTPLALLAYLALRRRVAVCVCTILVVLGLAAAPALVVGAQRNAELLGAFARYSLEKVDESDNFSLRGLLERALAAGLRRSGQSAPDGAGAPPGLLVSNDPRVLTIWAVLLLAIGTASAVVLWSPPRDTPTGWLELSFVMALILVVSPHTQRRYFVQLVVPAMLLLHAAGLTRTPLRTAAAMGLAAVATTGTVLPLVFGGRALALAYESAALYVVGAAVMAAVLMRLIVQAKRAGQAERAVT